MAERSFGERVEGAIKAVDRILAGDKVPFVFEADLRFVEDFLGLKRPLASYAPRTRRRYIAAAKAGDKGAKKTRSRESQMRSEKTLSQWGLTPHQLTELNRYRIPIMESGVDINEYLDPDVIRDVVQMYGFRYMLTVLRDQYNSIVEYSKGNREPGRQRWLNRGELEEAAKKEMNEKFAAALVYFAKGTDPYYYYHGNIK